MHVLGLAGLSDIGDFLSQNFPEQKSCMMQGMDAAAALIRDGEVIAAVSQERFDREKKSGAFPFDAINYCLNAASIGIQQLDSICGNFDFGRYQVMYGDGLARQYYLRCLSPQAITERLATYYDQPITFTPIEHHEAHLHSALATAEFDTCLAIIMDAAGEAGSTSVYRVERGKIKRLRRYGLRQSLGLYYSLITAFLGFAANEDEYKIMGLAAAGDPDRYEKIFRSAIVLSDHGKIAVPDLSVNIGFAENMFFDGTRDAIQQAFGFDGANCSMSQRADVSAGLQKRFTEALFHIAGYFQKQTGLTNLIMSGGCAENCSAIGALRNSGMFARIHVSYASGDEGTALGAGAAYLHGLGRPLHIPKQMPFYGPSPRLETVQALVAARGLKLEEFGDENAMLEAAARDIAANKIVALCNGRMEYGARALGNRSLLALPSQLENKERINLAIKKRQNYRPFAPAVTLEDAHRYFDLAPGEEYPYMTMLTRVRDESQLPAVTHFDRTARVQTVDRDFNPVFHRFLTYLKRINGVPVVLNTSYNVNHQPIVCTEQEAIDTFMEMGIDALYIADSRVTV